ncbi:hypothetical protein QOZ80_6AG0522300 [Eleusine coracana subsp. coracana]|nr:hypothetical protein QOZ80_6AG0522300 [Eleusine coracana subsp. coracana]
MADPRPSMVIVLESDALLCSILRRLSLSDLVRAALACHHWCGAASRVAPHAPPLLGYLFHPVDTPPPPPFRSEPEADYPAVFIPLDTAAPRLSLDAGADFSVHDVHLGLVLLLPRTFPGKLVPRILALDPASGRRALLPPPPRETLPGDKWRPARHVVGVAVLSRAHPSRLRFEAVCLTIDGDRPRAWVASVRDEGDCAWRALPRSGDVQVGFDPFWLEGRSVHAAGDVYWHICNSPRALKLDPRTLEFSYMLAPAEMVGHFAKFRIGETPEDGRLCVASAEDQQLRVWVRVEDADNSDNGWMLVRQMGLKRVYDSVPELPRTTVGRNLCTDISDIDAARTGKVFIETLGFGHYSFHVETRELQRPVTQDGKDYGHPIYAYYLAWPPAFLASSQ